MTSDTKAEERERCGECQECGLPLPPSGPLDDRGAAPYCWRDQPGNGIPARSACQARTVDRLRASLVRLNRLRAYLQSMADNESRKPGGYDVGAAFHHAAKLLGDELSHQQAPASAGVSVPAQSPVATPVTESTLAELERLYGQSTPGDWKLWGRDVESDQVGDSDHDKAVPVARFHARRTFDAELTCVMRRNLPALIAAARAVTPPEPPTTGPGDEELLPCDICGAMGVGEECSECDAARALIRRIHNMLIDNFDLRVVAHALRERFTAGRAFERKNRGAR